MKKNKILMIFPDGIGIKNYLYSDLIKNLKNKSKLFFWSTLPKEAFDDVAKLHEIEIDLCKIKLEKENFATRFLRESSTYSRILCNAKLKNNDSILLNWNKNNKSIKLRILYFFAEILGFWASKKYSRILKIEKIISITWKKSIINKYRKQLQELNPSTIFITHQRVAGLMPMCIAAKELGIKVVAIIYSWDNLPKARLAIKADKYLVWSNYMKNEMYDYYPEINQENVIVTGTTQFEFYLQKERLVSKDDFAKKYNLNPNKKWVCFSGDDVLTSPFDDKYLQDFAIAISDIEINLRPQIIFRRCPVDFSDRYNQVLNEHQDLIFQINPIWTFNNSWGTNFSKIADLDLMTNLGHHCEFVVNIGSTMAHDFSIFDKPCFYFNYDIVKSEFWSTALIYKFQHFRSLDGIDAVGWFNSKDEIGFKVKNILKNSNAYATQRKIWTQKIIKHPLNENSSLIANELLAEN